MAAYYHFVKREQQADGVCVAHYQLTKHTQGAWSERQQHMAPVTGVMTAELEHYAPQQHMRIARISCDILGLIPLDDFTITTRCLRPGKTIELLEAVMSSQGRDRVIVRAWRLITQDTSEIAGLEDQKASHQPAELEGFEGVKAWPGGYIDSVRLLTDPERRPGRGMVWLTNDLEMVAGKPTDDLVRLLGMVDRANGIVQRLGLGLTDLDWVFPNTDLQIHMHRRPQGQWLGIEAVQQYGADAVGLTSAVLHDMQGPFGRSEQILTIRPMAK